MKKIFFLYFILFLFLSVFFLMGYFYWAKKHNIFSCTADVDFNVIANADRLRVDGDYDIIFYSDDTASIQISGNLYVNDEKFDLNRIYNLKVKRTNTDSLYAMKIISSNIHKLDTVLPDIYETYFLTQNVNVEFLFRISNLTSNLYVIEGLKRSYFTCLKQ